MKNTHQGYIDLTVAQIGVGVNTVAAKYLLTVMPIYFYLGIRFFATSVLLLILFKIRQATYVDPDHPEGKLTSRDWSLLCAASISAGPLFNILMMLGLTYTTATSAGIVMSTLPALLAVFSFWLLGEKLTTRKCIAIVLAVIGVMVLGLDNKEGVSDLETGSFLGDFLVFLAVIPEALFSVFAKLLNRRVTPLGAAILINAISTVFLIPLFIYSCGGIDFQAIPLMGWLVLSSTFVSSAGFYWLWGRGLSVIPTSTAGLFGGVMPIATAVIAVIMLGEIFSRYDGAGMFMVLFSIVVGTGVKFRHLVRR